MKFIEANHDSFFKDIENPWSIGGEEEVERIHHLLGKGKIFDLGFGVGRHVKQLLDLGHNVGGIDLSEIGYMRLLNDLNQKNQSAQLSNGNMFDYKFIENYDCIFSNMSLQYASSEEQFSDMICKMKKYTNKGGINYIKLPAQGMSLGFPYKILDLDALKSYYSDWEIMFDNYEKMLKENGKFGVYVTIIARKKS